MGNGTARRRPVPSDMFGGRLRGAYLLDLEVVGVEEVAPHVRAVTFASTDLVDFAFEPGQDLMIDFPAGQRQVRRRYTIRSADGAAGTVVIEFELHIGGGIATQWAAEAAVGDTLDAIGPRGTATLRPNAQSLLFVADDSAMPPTFAMLEALPDAANATAVLVTPHGPDSRPAPETDATLVWVAETQLPAAISDLEIAPGTMAYVNGERHLVARTVEQLAAAGIARDDIISKAYWRRDQANADHGEPSTD